MKLDCQISGAVVKFGHPCGMRRMSHLKAQIIFPVHISHQQQQATWEKEHKRPYALPSLASPDVSGGVISFWKYFVRANKGPEHPIGLEICCGKGRNAIWLAKSGAWMEAFDFSASAIKTAKSRIPAKVAGKISFSKHDAVRRWPFPRDHFDFVIDCFASTDIDGVKNRKLAGSELYRVLKPGGYFFIYTNSTKSELYKTMLQASYRVDEPNAFYYPGINKFEKVFDEAELDALYCRFVLREKRSVRRRSKVIGRQCAWEHFWRIYQKPYN